MVRAALVLVIAACWSNATPPVAPVQPVVEPAARPIVPYVPPRRTVVVPMTEFETLVAQITTSRDDMCACGDKQCADQVMADFMKWATEWSRTHPDGRNQFQGEELAQINEIVRGLTDCMSRATSGMPTP